MFISLVGVFCIILGLASRNCFPVDQNYCIFESTNSGILEVIVKFHMHGELAVFLRNLVIGNVNNKCPSTNCPLSYEKKD